MNTWLHNNFYRWQLYYVLPRRVNKFSHLRFLAVADVSRQSAPSLWMYLQAGNHLGVIAGWKVREELDSVVRAIVVEQMSETRCDWDGRLRQLHQPIHIWLKY